MAENTDRRLHRLYDDDLSEAEKAELEREIAERPELGKKLEGLHEVGVVLRAARTDDAPIDSDALWKAIEGQIAAPVVEKSKPALRAIEGGAPKVSAPPVEDARTRRRRQIGIFVGAFAIAAAALFVMYGQPDDTTVAEATTPDEVTPPDEAPDEAVAATDYTEVLAVDFGTNVGTIFAVEGEGGQRYAVVWLDDVMKSDELEAAQQAPTTLPD